MSSELPSSERKTLASSGARATTSTTSSCRAWSTRPSFAARTPTPTSARSTHRAPRGCPAWSACTPARTSWTTTPCRTPGLQAADALNEIHVDYEPLPAVVDAEKATQPGAPQLHENAPNNIVFTWTLGNKDGTEAAFQNAEVVVKQRLVNHRLIPNPMEVRGDIGWYNAGTDEYTVWMSSQTPHIQRLLL